MLLPVVGNKHKIDHIYASAIQDTQTSEGVQTLKFIEGEKKDTNEYVDVTFVSYDEGNNRVKVKGKDNIEIVVELDNKTSRYKLFVDEPDNQGAAKSGGRKSRRKRPTKRRKNHKKRTHRRRR